MGARCRTMAILAVALLGVVGCTPPENLDRPDPDAPSTSVSALSASLVPVTPDGLATGPGVTDATIALGLLVTPSHDLGFSQGVRLWATSVNTAGGICGRSVQVVSSDDAAGSGLLQAYSAVGRDSLGLIAAPGPAEAEALATRIASDQIPTLSPAAGSAQPGTGPIPIAAPDDIQTINAASYLEQAELLGDGPLGLLLDQSAAGEAGRRGAQWWAEQAGRELEVQRVTRPAPSPSSRSATADTSPSNGVITGTSGALAPWRASAIVSFAGLAATAELLRATPESTVVAIPVADYDVAAFSSAGISDATFRRLLVMSPTPVYVDDGPAARAVAAALPAVDPTPPGPRTLSGYATAATWGRLLVRACTDLTLTRTGITQALNTIGPAAGDFLFGATDPALVVNDGVPATRVSAIAVADPTLLGSLAPLSGLEAFEAIENYPN